MLLVPARLLGSKDEVIGRQWMSEYSVNSPLPSVPQTEPTGIEHGGVGFQASYSLGYAGILREAEHSWAPKEVS